MVEGHVRLEIEGPIAVLRLDNAPLHPLTTTMRDELREHALELADRDDVRSVVLTSTTDKSLSVGFDIRSFPADATSSRSVSAQEHAAYDALERIPQPLIAVVKGHTLGGGLELSLVADLRIAEPDASLGLPELSIGVFPSGGGTQRLPRIIGLGRASQLVFTAEPIDTETALAWGLVTEVAERGGAEARALELASMLAARPRLAVQAAKRCLRVGQRLGYAAGEAAELEAIATVFPSADAQEGKSAFLERRAPRVVHR